MAAALLMCQLGRAGVIGAPEFETLIPPTTSIEVPKVDGGIITLTVPRQLQLKGFRAYEAKDPNKVDLTKMQFIGVGTCTCGDHETISGLKA